MIEQIDEQLDILLDDIMSSEDDHAMKIAQHIKKINDLHKQGEIDDESRKELLNDACEIIEVEKESSELEAKAKLEKTAKLLKVLVKMV